LQQAVPQQDCIPVHTAVHVTSSHMPAVQTLPLAHGSAQLPQFFGSVSTLTHSVLQHFSFAPHEPQVLPPELPPELPELLLDPPLPEPAPELLPAPLLDPLPLLLLFPPELLAEPLLEPVMVPLLEPAPLPLPELPPLLPELPPLLPPAPEPLVSVDASVVLCPVPNDPPQYEESRTVASRAMGVVTYGRSFKRGASGSPSSVGDLRRDVDVGNAAPVSDAPPDDVCRGSLAVRCP
jgi:hypothetical protein